MQDLQNGWYVVWKEKNSDGEWVKSNSDYMSREKAEKIVNRYNEEVKEEEGTAFLCYDADFDIEEEEK